MRPGADVTFEKYFPRTDFSSGSAPDDDCTKQSIKSTVVIFFMELWFGPKPVESLTTRISPVECWINSNAVRHLYLPAAHLIVAVN